jgi:stage III sporulation protein AB
MLKILGALMIIFVCVYMGRILSGQLEKRCKLLHDLQQGLLALEREIGYTATPLPKALAIAGQSSGLAVCVFSEASRKLEQKRGISAQEAWEISLQKAGHELPLLSEDLAILSAFGRGLGLSDIEDQIKRLELSRQRLFVQEEEAHEQYKKLGKVWKNLGWAAGIAIAIISF